MTTTVILITGAAGYIGSHVAKVFSDASDDIILVLVDKQLGNYQSPDSRHYLIEGDTGDQAFIRQLLIDYQVEVICHLAAEISVAESISMPYHYHQQNLINTFHLLSACQRTSVRQFIFSSTAAVYGETSDITIKETNRIDPKTPYGRSKYMAECLIRDIAPTLSIQYAILRYFNVIGASPDWGLGPNPNHSENLLAQALQSLSNPQRPFQIFGHDYPTRDGTAIRDFIHVKDIAFLHYDIWQYWQHSTESLLVNCGYGCGHSVLEVVNCLKTVGQPFAVEYGQRRPGDLPQVVADPTLLKRILRWQPRFSDLAEMISTSYQWHQQCTKPYSDPSDRPRPL